MKKCQDSEEVWNSSRNKSLWDTQIYKDRGHGWHGNGPKSHRSTPVSSPIFEILKGLSFNLAISRMFKNFLTKKMVEAYLTVIACTSGNLVVQVQHGFSFKKI